MEEEVYTQNYFEDLETIHLWLKDNPENIFSLFVDLQIFFIENGYTNPEEIMSLSIIMLTFPYSGKDEMDEDEVMENYKKILTLFQCGAFMFGKN